jgi:hypothetical protein
LVGRSDSDRENLVQSQVAKPFYIMTHIIGKVYDLDQNTMTKLVRELEHNQSLVKKLNEDKKILILALKTISENLDSAEHPDISSTFKLIKQTLEKVDVQ